MAGCSAPRTAARAPSPCRRPGHAPNAFRAGAGTLGRLEVVARRVLISAGEMSGDLYAAGLVDALRRRNPDLEFFGCAGPRMQQAGVRAVVDSRSIAVVGLVEVITHIPRVYREYRKLVAAARETRPDIAILTDSPDFHLRLARQLKKLNIPVIYLVAPQVWAWRKGRLPLMRRTIDRLLCIFPFEPEFFAKNGIEATYIGHPLTRLVRASANREELRRRYGVSAGAPLVALLPGSREGEAARHLPVLLETVEGIRAGHGTPEPRFILAVPPGTVPAESIFWERISKASIQVVEGETWDVLACADLALAASGTVTIEASLLGTPLIAFYRVNNLSWWMGRHLVQVPFYSMVNLVAGRRIVPELIQNDLTAARLADEALSLLADPAARETMRRELRGVAEGLAGPEDPMELAASLVEKNLTGAPDRTSRLQPDTLTPVVRA
ncbi:MAG TPA: lipid-A-disaccharide synthase [Bryobacteraceae bacterium]|nr:lipid-A-disaccharide synthase [Bryobacteraceae bacterium]